MIPVNTLFLWLLLLNASAAGLAIWAYESVPKSGLRSSLLMALLGYTLWINPLILVNCVGGSSELIDWIARGILAGGCVFVASLGSFVIELANARVKQTLVFRFFIANFTFLFCMALLGQVEGGVTKTAYGLSPLPGPLQNYFNISMVVYGVYFIAVGIRGYRSTKDSLLKLQLRAVVFSCTPAFLLGLATNTIIPGLTGDFRLTPTGGLWLLIFFGGVAYILYSGRMLQVYDIFRQSTSTNALSHDNAFALQKVFGFLNYRLNSTPVASRAKFELTAQEGSAFEVEIEQVVNAAEPPQVFSSQEVSTAVLNTVDSLVIENVRLSSLVAKAESELEQLLGSASQPPLGLTSISRPSDSRSSEQRVSVDTLRKERDDNIAHTRDVYGIDDYAFSGAKVHFLSRIAALRANGSTFVLIGETGSGKKRCARLIEYSISGREIDYEAGVLGSASAIEDIREQIQSGAHASILLEHIDLLVAENISLLTDCYHATLERNTRMYLAASPGLFDVARVAPFDIVRLFQPHAVELPVLRACREDIPYAVVSIIERLEPVVGKSFEYIDAALLAQCRTYSWAGNFHELEQAVLQWMLASTGDVLTARQDIQQLIGSSIGQEEAQRIVHSALQQRRGTA